MNPAQCHTRDRPAPGRPRCEATTKAILAATRKLFEQSDLRSLTIEAIAKEAGVGKATIYRWWANKTDLVMDAYFEDLLTQADFATSGSPVCIIADQVARVVKAYSGTSGRMLAQLLAEAQYDRTVSQRFYEAYLSRRSDTLHTLLAQCGITSEAEQDMVAEQIYSPIFFRLLLGHAPLDKAFAEGIQTFVTQRLKAVSLGS